MTTRRFGSCSPVVVILAVSLGTPHLQGQENSIGEREDGKRLFTRETFGGNGRTCLTCHSLETGTVSPKDAKERLDKDYRDPLFLFDGSDDGRGNGAFRMRNDATIRITITLPPTVKLADDPTATEVVLLRGIPSTLNTPGTAAISAAIDAIPSSDQVLMLDGREPNLVTQAANAIRRHAQVTAPLSAMDLLRIAQFEVTDQFFSSPAVERYARGGPAPTLPEGRTDSEKRGRLFFVDAPIIGDGKKGSCAACHSGPMLNQTNRFLPLPVPPGTRFQTINVSEFNVAGNKLQTFIFRNADGSYTSVKSADPGRALITGVIDGDPAQNGAPLFTSLNAFKIPTLWGVKHTAPYFHDNSAKTLEDVVDHYQRLFQGFPPPIILTPQDKTDIVAYLKHLE